MNRTIFLLGVLAGLCCAGIARGQEMAAAFEPKPLWPAPIGHSRPTVEKHRAFWALVGIHAGVTVADIWSTERVFKYPGSYEVNPLLPRRPNAAEMSLEFAGLSFAGILATHYMETHGRGRLARGVLIGLIGFESFAVGNNLSVYRKEVRRASH